MTRFSYTAEKNNETYQSTAEAKDRFDLYQMIRREGGRILSVDEKTTRWYSVDIGAKFSLIGEHDKIMFARNVGSMLSAGLPLARSLAVLERQTKNKRMAEIVASIAGDVRRGETLNSSLAKYPKIFSSLFVAMVRAGEEGGDLPKSLVTASDQMDRIYTLKKKIRSALIYPSIIVIAIIGIGATMMVVVVPTLAATFKEMNADLPKSTQVIIAISNFLANNTLLALVLVAVGVFVFISALKTEMGRWIKDWCVLRMPIIKEIVCEVNAARTARTFSSLLSSGVDVLSSIDITRDVVQNLYFKQVLSEATESTGRGAPLSEAFMKNEHLYPSFVGEMMAVGEETGQTTEMLTRLATYYENEVDRKTKDLSTIIEPLLMLLIGAAVGFFAVSMIMPIYSLSQNI